MYYHVEINDLEGWRSGVGWEHPPIMQARKVRTLHQPFSSRSTFYETHKAEVLLTQKIATNIVSTLTLQLAARCYPTATSDRGCGWEDYFTSSLITRREASIKRSQWGNTSPPTIHKPHLRRLQSNHTFPVRVIKKLPRIKKFDTWQRFITTLQAHFVTR